MGGPEPKEGGRELERIIFFSDAVFAIAITLLVLELAVPEVPADRLGAALAEQLPHFFAYVLSFLVIGQYWMTHHRLFRHIRRYDIVLIWLNLLYLLGIAFLPYPTALLGAYPTTPLVDLFYGLSLLWPTTVSAVLWFYVRRRGFLSDELPPDTQRQLGKRAIATAAVFLVGAGAAFLSIYAGVFCWVVVLPFVRMLVVRRF
jgi:uncharacterized membrane protein